MIAAMLADMDEHGGRTAAALQGVRGDRSRGTRRWPLVGDV
jgi:hypothetical protein